MRSAEFGGRAASIRNTQLLAGACVKSSATNRDPTITPRKSADCRPSRRLTQGLRRQPGSNPPGRVVASRILAPVIVRIHVSGRQILLGRVKSTKIASRPTISSNEPYLGTAASAATPGSSIPARNSNDAPPPVEICEICFATPAAFTAFSESPPPTTEVAPELATA